MDMSGITTCVTYPCDGTAALRARSRRPERSLTVVEGGRAAAGGRRDVPGPVRGASLSARQTILAVAAGALVVLVALAASLVSDALVEAGRGEALGTGGGVTVTVCSGDSLWGLAEEASVPGVPTGDVVSWIMDRNGLDSSLLTPGQRLVVPASPAQ